MLNNSTGRMSPQKGIYFHASSVNVSGKALLFLGHSTSGKSTISRLLSERYPVIADDKVLVWRKRNGGWMIGNGDADFRPFGGNVFLTRSRKNYPLLAILRIFKSKTINIKPLSPRKVCRYLIDAVFEVDCQRHHDGLKTIKKWFTYTAEIAKEYKGWSLTFKKDKSIIKNIHDNFEK